MIHERKIKKKDDCPEIRHGCNGQECIILAEHTEFKNSFDCYVKISKRFKIVRKNLAKNRMSLLVIL